VRRMRGGAQAHLMRADDGRFYVVKFQNNPQHLRVLANELLATRLAESVGLPVPVTEIVEVREWLIANTPELRVDLAGLSSLNSDVNAAKVLAFSFPQLAAGIRKAEGKQALLTAVVEDDLPSDDESALFARETLVQNAIHVAPLSAMPQIARDVARELGIA
jgi:hypothetical protein